MILNIVLIGLVVVVIGLIVFLVLSQKNTAARIEELRRGQTENQALALMQQQIGQLTGQTNQQLQSMTDQFLKTSSALNQQIQGMAAQFRDTTGRIGDSLGDVRSHLGKVEIVTKEVLEKSKNIAALEDLLRAPKFRGGIGELFLGDLLQQILPPSNFEFQHKFKSGEIVDAVVKIGANLVPVDSKFPLENFQKSIQSAEDKDRAAFRKKFMTDVRKHIDTIAAKYILPDEGTYDFALMYIPAENIYYETILKDETFGEERSLFVYAAEKRVIPVSPNSFYAYLQVIVLGLKGLQIEKSAREIFRNIARLQGDLSRFRSEFQVLGTHLGNARAKYEEAEKKLDKVGDKMEQMQSDLTEKLPEGGSGPAGGLPG
jgi:DNA recombination protein RmuC